MSKPQISVADIRRGLLRRMQAEGWTYADLAAVVKRPDGSRYATAYLEHFLRDECPQSFLAVALAVIRSIPDVVAVCPMCGHASPDAPGSRRTNEPAKG